MHLHGVCPLAASHAMIYRAEKAAALNVLLVSRLRSLGWRAHTRLDAQSAAVSPPLAWQPYVR